MLYNIALSVVWAKCPLYCVTIKHIVLNVIMLNVILPTVIAPSQMTMPGWEKTLTHFRRNSYKES
jgi:hypothetical protein